MYTPVKDERLLYYLKRYAPSLKHISIKVKGRTYYQKEDGSSLDWAYVCPLCVDSGIAVDGQTVLQSNEFDLDHFPPKSVGGTRTVLTCTTCNSKAGGDFDYSLKEIMQFRNFWIRRAPDAEIETKVVYEGIKGCYKSTLKLTDGVLQHNYNLKKAPLVKEWLERATQTPDWKMHVSFTEPNSKLIHKALLKAAYLYCFSVWGYEFVFTHIATNIRKVLFDNHPHPLTNFGVFVHYEQDDVPEGVYFLQEPKALQCFVVQLSLALKNTDYRCSATILIPGVEVSEWDRIKVFQPLIDSNETFAPTFIRLREDFLDKGELTSYTKAWYEVRKTG